MAIGHITARGSAAARVRERAFAIKPALHNCINELAASSGGCCANEPIPILSTNAHTIWRTDSKRTVAPKRIRSKSSINSNYIGAQAHFVFLIHRPVSDGRANYLLYGIFPA